MRDDWERVTSEHRMRQADAIAHAALSLLLSRGASALTMAAVAEAADVSRQTLYRYFTDLDAVLIGIARLVAAQDDDLEALVRAEPDPVARLDALVRIVAEAADHDDVALAALRTALPPEARDVLATHEDRIRQVLVDVLREGVSEGRLGSDVDPQRDAPRILGLAAARPVDPERVITLVHRIVELQRDPT